MGCPLWGRTESDTTEVTAAAAAAGISFSGGSDGKESACNVRDLGSVPGLEKIPCRREWLLTPVFWPGEFHGQRSLAGYRPWGSPGVGQD